jgi:hypothetical protein
MSHDSIEFAAIESAADHEYYSNPIPHPASTISKWHLLTVLEDLLRMPFIGMVNTSTQTVESINDRSKYGLRHALNHITKKSDKKNDINKVPEKVIPPVYERAFALLKKGIDYERIFGFSSSMHNSHAELTSFKDHNQLTYARFIDARYGALEVLDHGNEPFLDISTLLFKWLRSELSPPAVIDAINASVTIKKKKLNYHYGHMAVVLANEIFQRPIIIPDELLFPWGTANDTQALINSLLIRCAYHIIAVNESAARIGISGGGEASLVLTISKLDLCRDISMFADIGEEKISDFVDHLTYGHKTSTPDPALQPIIPAKDILLLPCLHTLTCNIQRNILALFTRINPRDFDRQSYLFEKKMTDDLAKLLQWHSHFVVNKKFFANDTQEEVDVVIADPNSKIVILMELRWILQPGDAREVVNKMKECIKKISQIERKTQFFNANFNSLMNQAFPNLDVNDGAGWSAKGLVVLEGFGGILSNNPDFPIITSAALKIGLQHVENLSNLHDWVASLHWLPTKNLHFEDAVGEVKIDNLELRFPGLNMNVTSDVYRKHINNSTSSYISVESPI